MSAARQLLLERESSGSPNAWPEQGEPDRESANAKPWEEPDEEEPASDPPICMAFYRKHTERILRRYLYSSMQVGRSPSILGDSVGRGWVSSRRVRTFEDAVIFVLDMERCLDRLAHSIELC
jgi:hypothetical protein